MGEALRLLRIFNGYKSAELAKKLELSQSYVSELENGKKQPTIEVLDKYAKKSICLTELIYTDKKGLS